MASTFAVLAAETERADAAERQAADLLVQIRGLHKDKLQLRAELAKSLQELQLWKIQLDLAQKEILRAQTVVDQVDRARAEAEHRAYRYRQRLRHLLEEQSVQSAVDEGRRLGFQEGLELGRRRQFPHLPLRRTSTPVPVPPVPTAGPSDATAGPPEVIRPQPPDPPAPTPGQPEMIRPIQPIPVQNTVESVHDSYQIPPDNFIPVVHQGENGIALPPPHEWSSLPKSDSAANRPRSDSQTTVPTRPRSSSQSTAATRPRSESKASNKSLKPRDSRAPTRSSPPPPLPPPQLPVLSPVHEQPSQTISPPPSITSSSRISHFDLVGPPPPGKTQTRPQMTQPELIADEWRAQNPDMVTPTQNTKDLARDIITRPMSSATNRPIINPPTRPTTTDPSNARNRSGSLTSSLRTTASKPRKTRQVVLPIYDKKPSSRTTTPAPRTTTPAPRTITPAPRTTSTTPTIRTLTPAPPRTTSTTPTVRATTPANPNKPDPNYLNPNNADWLRSQFQKQRTTSNVTIPNIDVESPSEGSSISTNTEKTAVDTRDPVLLSPEDAVHIPIPPLPPQQQQQLYGKPVPPDTTYLPHHHHHQQQQPAYTHFYSHPHAGNQQPPGTQPHGNKQGGIPQMITGVLSSDKFLPPGFVPLSPIPTLSNLTSIPETCGAGRNGGVSSHSSSSSTSSSRRSGNGKPAVPDGKGIPLGSQQRGGGGIPVGYQPNEVDQSRGYFQYPPPMDIVVMRSQPQPQVQRRGRDGTVVSSRGGQRRMEQARSPAPLNRPLSIFDDDDDDV